MARLIVQAVGNETIADPGDRDAAVILLSVTDANGEPVTGLGTANVRIDAMLVAAYGAEVSILRMSGSTLPGFYAIDLVPYGTYQWKAGEFDIAVAVTQGSNKGQTFATFRVT
ncbi:MAG: hypothetical protein ACJ8GN_24060 [Longimicrobiaceae bacterium]